MRSRKKSPEDRYSFGSDIQKRAKTLLEALLDYGDEALKFGKIFKTEEIEVTPLNGKSNEPGLEFKVKRNLLANWIGIKTEKLTQQESKNVSEKIKNVVVCLKKFEIISFYKPHQSGWWKLILPHADKNRLIKKLPAFVECKEAIVKPHRESGEAIDTKDTSSQGVHSIAANSIRDRYFKSIDQLWSQDIGECISAIRKLEIIAKDYPAEQWAVMEALAEFVKIRAWQKEQKEGEEERSPKILECIKKALMVIGQPDFTKKNRLDLSRTNLAGVDLSQRQLNFELVDFTGANLTMANLRGTNFKGANFKEANLEYADFIGAILQTAIYDRRTLLTGTQFDEGIEWQLEGMCGWQLKIQKILRQWGCESVSDQWLETSFYTNPEEEDLFFPDSRPCKKGPLRRPTKRTKESGREVNPVE